MSTIFVTGGLAKGAISTKSSPSFLAKARALLVSITPTCFPPLPITLTFGARICSLVRQYFLFLLNLYAQIVSLLKLNHNYNFSDFSVIFFFTFSINIFRDVSPKSFSVRRRKETFLLFSSLSPTISI